MGIAPIFTKESGIPIPHRRSGTMKCHYLLWKGAVLLGVRQGRMSAHRRCMHGCMLCRVWLCDPTDCSLPGTSVHGILQARTLEWVAFPAPGDLPNPRIKPASLVSPALTCGFFTISITWAAHIPRGAYLHFQRDISMLPTKMVITGSHPRDLASPS